MEQGIHLYYSRFPTPLGTMIAAGTDDGICLLEFDDRLLLDSELSYLQNHFHATLQPETNQLIEELKSEIDKYFNGCLKQFSVKLITPGSPFQQDVWRNLQNIPFGHTISYQQLAISLGNDKAVRAVAKANSSNRIAIVIPCHRVTGKNGKLTGYSGGLWRKAWLLNHERIISADPVNPDYGTLFEV